jgi:PEP-CTERM motif
VKNNLLRLLAVLTVLVLANSTRAGMITYKFTGSVSSFVDYGSILPSDIGMGNTASGSFSYDDAAAGPQFYRGTQVQMSETVTLVTSQHTYTFSLTTPVGGDEIDLYSGTFGFYKRGPDVPLGFGNNAHVSFLDAFGFGSTSDDLSQTNVSLGFGSTIGISDANSSQSYYYIGISPDSLEKVAPSAVPEPASVVLCAAGIVTLAGYGWRRRRRAAI